MNHGLQRQLAKLRIYKSLFAKNQVNHESEHRETTQGLSRSRHRSESDEAVKTVPVSKSSYRRRHSSDSNTVVKYNQTVKTQTNDFLNYIKERRFM